MKIKRLKFKFILMISIATVFIFSNTLYSQKDSIEYNIFKRELIKKISKVEIYKADKNKLLNHNSPSWDDSIKAIEFMNKYWFWGQSNSRDKDESLGYELFAFDKKGDSLFQLTNFSLPSRSGYLRTVDGIYIFNEQLFFFNREKASENLLVIDADLLKIKKIIPIFPSFSTIKKIYVNDSNLYIEVQPLKEELNIWYYIGFWLPRHRPNKWDFINDGNSWLITFDKYFNIISKEEFK